MILNVCLSLQIQSCQFDKLSQEAHTIGICVLSFLLMWPLLKSKTWCEMWAKFSCYCFSPLLKDLPIKTLSTKIITPKFILGTEAVYKKLPL